MTHGASLKGEIMCELTLESVNPRFRIEPKFILHSKEDNIRFSKYGISHKGLNRMIRKIIGRLNP